MKASICTQIIMPVCSQPAIRASDPWKNILQELLESLTLWGLYQISLVCQYGLMSRDQKKGLQLSVLIEIRVWQVLDESHTLSIKLKWSMPSAKPHIISVRWCFPSSTRDMPTRKAHSTNRMRSGTARTRWDSRNLETIAARLA